MKLESVVLSGVTDFFLWVGELWIAGKLPTFGWSMDNGR